MDKWISVKDRLPEGGQDVLTYYNDEPYETKQIDILTYYKKGDVIDYDFSTNIKNPERRLLDSLFNSANEIKADEDGFYIYDDDGWRMHADIITHWMPLPEPPDEEDTDNE